MFRQRKFRPGSVVTFPSLGAVFLFKFSYLLTYLLTYIKELL